MQGGANTPSESSAVGVLSIEEVLLPHSHNDHCMPLYACA